MILQKEGKVLTLEEFVQATGVPFLSHLDFEDPKIRIQLQSDCAKLKKKGELSREQLWFGCYYQKEILEPRLPPVSIRWIDPRIGWGVFAERDLKKGEFIAEYGGKVRKRKSLDSKNAYCFEYVLTQGVSTPFNIDAQNQGGVARYINHSFQPNRISTLCI